MSSIRKLVSEAAQEAQAAPSDYEAGWVVNGDGDHWSGSVSSWKVYDGPHGSKLAGTLFPDLSGRMFASLHDLTGNPPSDKDLAAWHKLHMRKSDSLMFKRMGGTSSLVSMQKAVDAEAAKYQ